MGYTNFRIFNTNYADTETVANFDYSSQDSSFTATNVLNQQRRSKVWRSDGYWVITSSNRNLVFRETTGVDITAILNTGTYNTTASFITELERALNSAGSSTYTVTQTSGLRFQFASNGAGGGGIFELRLSGSSVASLIGLTSDKTGALTHICDLIIVTSEEWLEFDMGVSTNPDAFIMVDQRNDPFKVSGTIKLQGNITGNFSSPEYDQTLTLDDEAIAILSDNGLHTRGLRFWRVKFEKTDMPTGYFQVGAIMLGNYWKPDRARVQFSLRQNYIDRSVTVFAEGGESFSDIKEKTQSFNLIFKGMQKADVEIWDGFFYDFGIGKPFFVSMDTGEVWSSAFNRRIVLCKFESAPNYELVSPNNFTLSVNIREEL